MAELSNMFNGVLLYIPNILKALVLFLIAWGIAVLVKNLLEKLLFKMKAEDKLSKGRTPVDPEWGSGKVHSIAKIAYFLVFLLFLPSILDALEMESVSGPISNMMQNLLAFIPRILGAAVILVIGFFVAKLIKDLVFNLLQTANIDKWYNKMNPAGSYENTRTNTIDTEVRDSRVAAEARWDSMNNSEMTEKRKATLADILSKIIFGLVLIPVITMALETLNIQTLTQPIMELLNKVMNMIPNIFVAIILIILGYYIARFISQIVEQLLSKMGIEKLYGWMDDTTHGNLPRFDLPKIIGNVVQVLIMLFITVEALSILNLEVLNTIGYAVINYLPLVLSGLIIISLGVLGGYVIEGLINKYADSPFTAAIAKYIIIIFAVFMTLEQIKFASTIVNIAFLLVLGALSVAFALSFGLGGRDFAKRQLEKFERKAEKENKKPGITPDSNKSDDTILL